MFEEVIILDLNDQIFIIALPIILFLGLAMMSTCIGNYIKLYKNGFEFIIISNFIHVVFIFLLIFW